MCIYNYNFNCDYNYVCVSSFDPSIHFSLRQAPNHPRLECTQSICLKTYLSTDLKKWGSEPWGHCGGNRNCKGPEVGECLVCSRSNVTGAACWARAVGDEAGEVVGG